MSFNDASISAYFSFHREVAMYVLFTRYHGLLLYRGRRSNVEYDASQQEDTLFVVRELLDGEVLL